MTLICCASVSGSPGVTTAALGLAVCWPASAAPVLVEADPSGGDLQVLFGLPDTPGMVSLAAAARRSAGPDLLQRHARQLPSGLAVVPGAVGAEQAQATAALLAAGSWAAVTAAAGGQVIVADCGRASPGTPVLPLLAAADMLLIVTSAAAEALAHLHARLDGLLAVNPRLQVLLSGPPGPYPAAEISQAVHVELAGRLPFDRAGAAMLRGGPARRGPRTLWRSPASLPLLAAAAETGRLIAGQLEAPGAALPAADGKRGGSRRRREEPAPDAVLAAGSGPPYPGAAR